MHVLKRHTSVEEANKIAATMDKDGDGIVTVEELMDWVQHRQELLDELGADDVATSTKTKATGSSSTPPSTPKAAAATSSGSTTTPPANEASKKAA